MSDVYEPINPVSMEFGDIIGARRYLKWKMEGEPRKKGKLEFGAEDLGKYKKIIPIQKYYNKKEIQFRAAKTYHFCKRNNFSERQAKKFVRFLDRQIKKTVYVEEKQSLDTNKNERG